MSFTRRPARPAMRWVFAALAIAGARDQQVNAQAPTATPLAIAAVVDAATRDLPAIAEATARATAASEAVAEFRAA